MAEWYKSAPDGCLSCSTTERKHLAKGLCSRCYQRYSRSGVESVEQWLNDSTRITDVPSSSDELRDEDDITTNRQGESRPSHSSVSPPSSEGDDSPGVEEKKRRGFFSPRSKKEKETRPKSNETRPKGTAKRIPAAQDFSDGYLALAGLVGRVGVTPENPIGVHAPLSRYLAWQSPAAGELLDDVVKNTFVDRKVVQPAVRMRSSIDILVALLGPPALIIAIESNPSRAESLLPVLKSSIRSSLPTLLPAMKKHQAREEKIDEAVREMFPDLPPGVDPVDEILATLFNGYQPKEYETANEYSQ